MNGTVAHPSENKLLARAVTSLSSQITEVNRTVCLLLDRVGVLAAQIDSYTIATRGAPLAVVRRATVTPEVPSPRQSQSHKHADRDTLDGGHVPQPPADERSKKLSFGGAARVAGLLAGARRHSHAESDAMAALAVRSQGESGSGSAHDGHALDSISSSLRRSDQAELWTGDQEIKQTVIKHKNGVAFSAPRDVRGVCECGSAPTDLYHYNPSSGWILNKNIRQPPAAFRIFSYGALMNMCWKRFVAAVLAVRLVLLVFFTVLFALGGWSGPPPPVWDAVYGAAASLPGGALQRALQIEDWSYVGAVTTLQSGVTTGWWLLVAALVYHKVARPCNPVVLANKLCVAAVLGRPTLVTRAFIAKPPWYILNARVQVTWIRLVLDPGTKEPFQKHDNLEVEGDTSFVFDVQKVIRHVIDQSSPLYGKPMEQLVVSRSVFTVTILGIEPLSGQTIAATQSYRATHDSENAVLFGRQFAPFMQGLADVPAEDRAKAANDPTLPEMPAQVPVLDPAALHRLQGDDDSWLDAWGRKRR